jgi:tetratricopeptide (TPR) repeat protein
VREGRWAFKFNRKELFAASGATGMAPASPIPDAVDRILLLLGGPVANLLTALLAFGISIPGGDGNTGQWRGIVALFAIFNLIGFAFNLIPMPGRRIYSDGAQLYQLLAGGPWADWQRAAFGATSILVTPFRPRDFDSEMMTRAAEGVGDGRRAMQMWLYSYEHFLDVGELDKAAEALRKAESIYPQVSSELSAGLHAIFVFANAFLNRDAVAARTWWERLEAKKPTRFNGGYWLAHSALHWIEGNQQMADESWEKGNDLVQKQPKAGAYEFNRHCFALLRQAMDEVPVSA